MQLSLWQGFEHGIFWITRCIAIGRFATVERSRRLLEQGVTHVLNVSEAPSLADVAKGDFHSVVDVPIVDLQRIRDEIALRCIDLVHEALGAPGSKLYLHCTAGQYRSPTILWLYLVATGIAPEEAKRLIVAGSPDAIPGHSSLIADPLIATVRRHGETRRMAFKLDDAPH